MSMTDEEWKEAQALAARCIEDPWALTYGVDSEHPCALHDKHAFSIVEVYNDERRFNLPGHVEDTYDDARDIEAMRRLFPKLVDQRSARDAMIAAMPDKLRAVYEAARACWLGLDPRAEHEAALEAALSALEPPA